MIRHLWGLNLLLVVWLTPTLGGSHAALPDLIETLTKGTDTAARIEAAKQLAQSGQPQAVEVLVKSLEDANRPVRWASIEALGELRKKETVPALLQYLDRKEAYRFGKILTANALAAIGDPRAVQPLMGLLKSTSDPILQRVVILALGELGDAGTIPVILEFLKDERRWMRTAAQVALVQLTRDAFQGQQVPRGYKGWMEWYNRQGKRRAAR